MDSFTRARERRQAASPAVVVVVFVVVWQARTHARAADCLDRPPSITRSQHKREHERVEREPPNHLHFIVLLLCVSFAFVLCCASNWKSHIGRPVRPAMFSLSHRVVVVVVVHCWLVVVVVGLWCERLGLGAHVVMPRAARASRTHRRPRRRRRQRAKRSRNISQNKFHIRRGASARARVHSTAQNIRARPA